MQVNGLQNNFALHWLSLYGPKNLLCVLQNKVIQVYNKISEVKVEGETTPFWSSYLIHSPPVFLGLLPYIALIKLIDRSTLDICCPKYIALIYITQFNDK